MTKPISNERVQWLNERAKVLDECIRIASAKLYAMTSGGGMHGDLQSALRNFREERTAISIELSILIDHFNVTP